ncbi:putative sterigmatocystin biosynthesis monooxygenase stcW [Cryomyces minteri]|nr:putative sterigmatocystin biosynthesis monooxygenase stcW [Cryomyces minteri]
MQNENIRSWVPKQDVTDRFNEHCQEWIKHTVWKEDCRSWYKNNETGRVNAVWPGSSMHYVQVVSSPRYEDFDITYHNKNQWAHLGLGWTVENRTQGMDSSPYISIDNIDPKWLEAVGSTPTTTEKKDQTVA